MVLGAQPVCTEATFTKFIGPSLHGDTELVARAIFDEYLENVASLDTAFPDRQTPTEFVLEQQARSNKADTLFDSLLDSLEVLGEDRELQSGIQAARRSVLLNSRKANNPWPATQWYDIAELVKTNPQFLDAVDAFILEYADVDRDDRFAATIAMLEGNKNDCAEAERRTMQRWAIYNELIEPFENELTLEYRYPSIPKSELAAGVFITITNRIKNSSQTDSVRNIFRLYAVMHNKQKRDIIELIKNARINDGVDPLSSGCGSSGKTRNRILQRTAQMRELNETTLQSMLQVLTLEQRQELELDG